MDVVDSHLNIEYGLRSTNPRLKIAARWTRIVRKLFLRLLDIVQDYCWLVSAQQTLKGKKPTLLRLECLQVVGVYMRSSVFPCATQIYAPFLSR